MDPKLKEAIRGSLANVFSQFFEVTSDFVFEETQQDLAASQRCAAMNIEGTFRGRLFLLTSSSLCGKLINSLFPGEIPSEELEWDVVGELLNMVGEGTRTLVNQEGGQQSIGVPDKMAPPTPDALEKEDVLVVSEMGESISVWLTD
jgi:CheY-specific phosphatase CheX